MESPKPSIPLGRDELPARFTHRLATALLNVPLVVLLLTFCAWRQIQSLSIVGCSFSKWKFLPQLTWSHDLTCYWLPCAATSGERSQTDAHAVKHDLTQSSASLSFRHTPVTICLSRFFSHHLSIPLWYPHYLVVHPKRRFFLP